MWSNVMLAGLLILAAGGWGEFRYRERLRLDRERRHAAHLAAMSAVAWTRIRAYRKFGYQWRQP